MEALTNMMSIIDLNSESIPEGDYLKLCNFMRDLHKIIPKTAVNSPPPPFSPVAIPEDLRIARDNWQRELCRVTAELKLIKSRIKALKIRRNITEAVRREAIREAANRWGVRLQQLTIQNLRENGVVFDSPYRLYKEYLDRTNANTQELLDNLTVQYEEKLRERDDISEAELGIHQEIRNWRDAH
jgi:hypothetical protein